MQSYTGLVTNLRSYWPGTPAEELIEIAADTIERLAQQNAELTSACELCLETCGTRHAEQLRAALRRCKRR
jgi:hypothetical protein